MSLEQVINNGCTKYLIDNSIGDATKRKTIRQASKQIVTQLNGSETAQAIMTVLENNPEKHSPVSIFTFFYDLHCGLQTINDANAIQAELSELLQEQNIQALDLSQVAKAIVITLKVVQLKQLAPQILTEQLAERLASPNTLQYDIAKSALPEGKCEQRKQLAAVRQLLNLLQKFSPKFIIGANHQKELIDFSFAWNFLMLEQNILFTGLSETTLSDETITLLTSAIENFTTGVRALAEIREFCHTQYQEIFDKETKYRSSKQTLLTTLSANEFPLNKNKPFQQAVTGFVNELTSFHALRMFQLDVGWNNVDGQEPDLSGIFKQQPGDNPAASPAKGFKYTNRFKLVMDLVKQRTLKLAEELGYDKLVLPKNAAQVDLIESILEIQRKSKKVSTTNSQGIFRGKLHEAREAQQEKSSAPVPS